MSIKKINFTHRKETTKDLIQIETKDRLSAETIDKISKKPLLLDIYLKISEQIAL